MKIVVTGATGSLGTGLLRRLAGTPHEVVGVARRTPPRQGPYAAADWVGLDLAADDARARLAEVLAGADACVHLAWAFQPMHHVAYQKQANLGGTAAALRATLDAGVPHFVQASSVAAYAPRRSRDLVPESWPTTGLPTSEYSRQKVWVERFLDAVEHRHGDRVTVSRVRPPLVGQRAAGGMMRRAGMPLLTPGALLGWMPVLPLDRSHAMQFVHADDVGDALVRIVERRAPGAFNLAAEPVLTRDDIAAALGTRPVHVPDRWLRQVAALAWHARLQPLDPGWLDMAFAVPFTDQRRAREELGWRATRPGGEVIAEMVRGMADGAGTPSQALRPRDLGDDLRALVRSGLVSHRRFT